MNIAFVCSDYDINRHVAYKVSVSLDMFYIDADDFIKYDLVEAERAKAVCSKDYLKNHEHSCVKEISSYDNTVISISDELYIDSVNKSYIYNNRVIFFIDVSKKNQLLITPESKMKNRASKAREPDIRKNVDFTLTYKTDNLEDLCNEALLIIKNIF